MNRIDKQLVYIGIRVAGEKPEESDIELTLITALNEVENDPRMLSLIFSWFKVHGRHVISDKLAKIYKKSVQFNGENPWFVALCAYAVECGHHGYKKYCKKLKYKKYYRDKNQDALYKLKGVEAFLERLNIIVPNGFLRIRESDVMSKQELSRKNLQYRNRLLIGSNIRADIITEIEKGAENPYRISKALGCSYESSHRIWNEYNLAVAGA